MARGATLFAVSRIGAGGQVGFITRATFSYIGGLFAGSESVDQMSGMVGMSQITGAPCSLFSIPASPALPRSM